MRAFAQRQWAPVAPVQKHLVSSSPRLPARRIGLLTPTGILALQRTHGNQFVQRLLAVQRDGDDDVRAEMLKRRSQAAGMAPEDVAQERALADFVGSAGARATAEAQGLTPQPMASARRQHLELTLAANQEREQTSVEQAATADHAHLVEGLARQRGAVRGLSLAEVEVEREGVDESFLLGAGRAATSEARQLTPTGPAPGQLRRINQALGGKLAYGALDQPQALVGLVADQLAALQARITAAHADVRAAVDTKVTDTLTNTGKQLAARADAAQVVAAGVSAVTLSAAQAALHGLETGLKSAETAFVSTEQFVTGKARDRIQTRVNKLRQRCLDTMRTYNAPQLQAAYQKVDQAMTAGGWFDMGPLVDALEAEHARMHPAYARLDEIGARINGLPAPVAGMAALVPIVAQFNTRTTVTVDRLPSLANRVDQELWSNVLQPSAQARWANVPKQFTPQDDAASAAAIDNMLQQGIIKRGQFNKKYRTSWDTGTGFSVEYTIQGLPTIVIHAHCEASGRPKDGANATHWKTKASSSHRVPAMLCPGSSR
ncbi:MAG: hypothetical protein JO023_10920 [Chloroflexi bacterium]|nr:hypothetical protein [Chloroflexota bacterium]